jgi:hypothetical protein
LPRAARHAVCNSLCVTETEGDEPLASRINVEKRHVVGTENPVIADLPVGADARSHVDRSLIGRCFAEVEINRLSGTAAIGSFDISAMSLERVWANREAVPQGPATRCLR